MCVSMCDCACAFACVRMCVRVYLWVCVRSVWGCGVGAHIIIKLHLIILHSLHYCP